MTTEGWIFMVGFRVFDVGLLVVWLIWFFRLRDDGDDSPGTTAAAARAPAPVRAGTDRAATASASRSAAGLSAGAATGATRRRPGARRRGSEPLVPVPLPRA